MSDAPLPRFARPPVVETALSLQFDPPAGLTSGHLGAFWKTLGSSWPKVEDAPPIADAFERFGADQMWRIPSMKLRFDSEPKLRLMIRDASETRLIQVQSTRLIHNWIRKPDVEYPHHEDTSKAFHAILEKFKSFLTEENLDPLRFNQWEVTYVNHIFRDTVWRNPADWSSAFKVAGDSGTISGLTVAEAFQSGWVFEILPQRGRLHVSIESGHRENPEGPDLIVMKLTARGPLSSENEVEESLALGRESVVRTFAELTTEHSHRIWERQR